MNPAAEIDSLITRFVAGQAFYDFCKAFPRADAERELGLVGELELRERLRNFRIASTEGSTGTQLP